MSIYHQHFAVFKELIAKVLKFKLENKTRPYK